MLANPSDKISYIAFESGYRHLGLFNAMFKKRFGVTPGEWRRLRVAGTNETADAGSSEPENPKSEPIL